MKTIASSRRSRRLIPDAWNNQMYKIRVFDQLVYDADPNLTNVLIGPDWQIWRVDFGRAFRLYKDLQNPKDLIRCDRQLFTKLKALNGNEVAGKDQALSHQGRNKGCDGKAGQNRRTLPAADRPKR